MKEETTFCPTRRAFCARAASLAVCSSVLSTLLEGCGSSPTSPSTSAQPLPRVAATRGASGLVVTVDSSSPLSVVGNAALVETSTGNFLIGRTSESSFVALTAICTHQACTITGFSSQHYVCPCHGSTYDLNGRVIGGPAPAALRVFPTQFANGVLTITA